MFKKNSHSVPLPYHPFNSKEAKKKYLSYYETKTKNWPVASDFKIIETSYGSTYVRISGPISGPTLVLIPGDTENSLSWIRQIEKLSENYRTYTPDPIFDFGRSVSSRSLKKPSDFVNWLKELFKSLELRDINLVGYSYGGWYTTLYGISHPEHLNKLIVISPSNTVLRGKFKAVFWAIFQDLFPTRNIISKYLYWSYANAVNKNEMTRKVIDEMVIELLLCKASFKRRRFVVPTVLEKEDWQKLKVPTLFIVGENEYIYSAHKAVRHLNSVAPDIKTVVIPDVGHGLMIVEPERVNNEILNFLDDSSGRQH